MAFSHLCDVPKCGVALTETTGFEIIRPINILDRSDRIALGASYTAHACSLEHLRLLVPDEMADAFTPEGKAARAGAPPKKKKTRR